MVKYISVVISAAVLFYGGIIDFKRREIPDIVPISLLLVGSFLNFFLLHSIIGLVTPAVLMFVAAKLTKSEIPGGDLKLLCSLGFACGLLELAAIVLLSGIGALVYGLARRLPAKRHIPLCAYIAPAYIALQVASLTLAGGGSM